ncbi:MAG: asparagine synthase (glutamine-hydrolyzing) [Rhodospirillales bacterium]|nr:asparagine synthase (glutamine-hydrolyzing) [Rhodospirillales bacterium]MSP80284.1 asparagine synthase (glutamine-hydrolyzing) [Rhodospirillales bacterium]
MCGIAGIMTLAGKSPDQTALEKMQRALGHRGPDGSGRWFKDNVGLTQTRLAIIDLVTGDQPIIGPDGATALVANGEIYNYIELRAELAARTFRTASDCEPPLHLYLRDGPEFVRHLRGMYALAIHDPGRGRLVLARDPFGIKPLYYAETADGFAFASEARALIAGGFARSDGGASFDARVTPVGVHSHDDSPARPILDAPARDEALELQFTTGRRTLFQGIFRVLPGEVLVVEQGRIVSRFIRPALPAGGVGEARAERALMDLDQLLNEAVELHQRADVPYGMFLSGGVDSSVLLAMMARLNPKPVIAFTAAFPGTRAIDERAHARAVAKAAGAEHVEVEFDESDFWRLLPRVMAAMDDFCADYAVLPTFKLGQAARAAGLKVILSGEGGDEIFAGYGRYRSAMRPRFLFGRPMRLKGALHGLDILRAPAPNWRDGIAQAEIESSRGGRTPLQAAQAADCADWLPNDLLTKLDRCLMAHGVEGRVPFLDPRLAAFGFGLPDALKVHHGRGKWLLRRWLETALPEARPFAPKRGFTVPVGEWIASRGRTLGPLVARQPGVLEACRPEAVERLFASVAERGGGAGLRAPSARSRHAAAAWHLLAFALWHRSHILGGAAVDDAAEALAS